MGILAALARPEERGVSVGDPNVWERIFGGPGRDSKAGVTVTHDKALSATTVFQAVRLISETLATVPLKLYRADGRVKEPARDHRVYRLLHDEPNEEQTAAEFREMLLGWAVMAGTGYAHIVRNNGGQPMELWPIPKYRVRPNRIRDGTLEYEVTVPSGAPRTVKREDMLVLRGFSLNGVLGEDAIHRMREAFGLTLATEEFGSKFFGQGATISGAVEHPQTLTPGAADNLRKQLNAEHSGLEKSHRIMLLQEGMKFTPGGITPEQGQMLETRKFQVTEVARAFNIPPNMLMDLERATFSNVEQQFIQFVTISLRPWAVRLEQAAKKRLLTDTEKGRYTIVHSMEGLLRGDSETRSQFYQSLFQVGALSPNDILELEDMNPVEGGDQRFVPLNMVPLDAARPVLLGEGERAVPVVERRQVEERGRERVALRQTYRPQFRDTSRRWIRRQTEATRAAVKRTLGNRDADSLRAWLERFYEEDHPAYVRVQLRPLLASYMAESGRAAAGQIGVDLPDIDQEVEALTRRVAARETQSALNQLREILRETAPDEVEAALLQRLDEWDEDGAEKFAEREVVDAGEGVARFVWGAVGVAGLVWRANRGACPLCRKMDGRRVGIADAFLGAGEEVNAEGSPPLRTRRPVTEPQLHRGCECRLDPII